MKSKGFGNKQTSEDEIFMEKMKQIKVSYLMQCFDLSAAKVGLSKCAFVDEMMEAIRHYLEDWVESDLDITYKQCKQRIKIILFAGWLFAGGMISKEQYLENLLF